MAFYLKKTKNNKGTFLQIYQNIYISGKGNRGHSYKSFGYLEELAKDGKDPIKEIQKIVDELNEGLKGKAPQIAEESTSKNVGYFILKSMIDYLGIDNELKIMTSNKKFHFEINEFIRSMIYAQVANPGSKLQAVEKVIPNILGITSYSYDQVLDGIKYIGQDYQKYIELLNKHINEKLIKRDLDKVYFDCTNYYFEIDLPKEDKQKGPSKENSKSPIIGQALLLDANQIPIGMLMYPGNESEKPKIRQQIEDTKTRYNVEGKTIQVADKGLNCARNIYSASVEAKDGYIFSKSIHGKGLVNEEKKWILLDDKDENIWHEVKDKNDKIIYKYKSCIDDFKYAYVNEEGEKIEFTVKEKRVATYNPSLARKQRNEIEKEIDKVKTIMSIKEAERKDYGDCIKYVIFDKKVQPKLNEEKIKEDLSLAGYNLLVTSEIDKNEEEIYNIYHGLWKIENSFRIMKTYLEARPVFLQTMESIYGHFLIVYYALTLLRLLELYTFKNQLTPEQIITFIRDYKVTKNKDNSYINNTSESSIYKKVKEVYGLSKLGNLYLSKKDIDNILDVVCPFDNTMQSLDNIIQKSKEKK